MPHSGAKPYGTKIQDRARLTASAAAEGEIHVFLEPFAKSHMPTAPEFADRARHIRVKEVIGRFIPEHSSDTARHKRISVKLKIKIKREGEKSEPRERCRYRINTNTVDSVKPRDPHPDYSVSKEYFKCESDNKFVNARVYRSKIYSTLLAIFLKIVIGLYRSAEHLSKIHKISSKSNKGLLRFDPSIVDLTKVGHVFEHIKAESNGCQNGKPHG